MELQTYRHCHIPILCFTLIALYASALQQQENEFLGRIHKARQEEVSKVSTATMTLGSILVFGLWGTQLIRSCSVCVQLRLYMYLHAVMMVVWDALPLMVTSFTFLFHTLVLKQSLTADRGYASMALFDLLRHPMLAFPDLVSQSITQLAPRAV